MEGEVGYQVCPFCAKPVTAEDYFCPHCGKKIRDKPLSTTLLTQFGIYALSFFLPPLGLWPAFRYLRQSDQAHKRIGWIAIGLTIITVVLTSIITVGIMNSINATVNTQLQQYSF